MRYNISKKKKMNSKSSLICPISWTLSYLLMIASKLTSFSDNILSSFNFYCCERKFCKVMISLNNNLCLLLKNSFSKYFCIIKFNSLWVSLSIFSNCKVFKIGSA